MRLWGEAGESWFMRKSLESKAGNYATRISLVTTSGPESDSKIRVTRRMQAKWQINLIGHTRLHSMVPLSGHLIAEQGIDTKDLAFLYRRLGSHFP